jgi:hypothetical protein
VYSSIEEEVQGGHSSSSRQGKGKVASETKVVLFFFCSIFSRLILIDGSTISLSTKLGDNVPAKHRKHDVPVRTSKTTKSTKFPTGLVTDWRRKVSKTSHVTQYHQRPQASPPLGGLADDDAHGERPDHQHELHDKTRKNEVTPVFISAPMRDC